MENLILTNLSLQELKSHISDAVRSEIDKHIPNNGIVEKDEFLTRKQAAKLLGISLPTLAKWTKEGLIPSLRISSRIRYTRQGIENSLKSIRISKSTN
jgi:excisionase family DNA binding protein